MGASYIKLCDLEVYKISVDLGGYGWKIYKKLDWRDKKVMGDQFIRSVDSCAANIAEGYGRYHYLDRIKFYYNARASLMEAKHWVLTLNKRGKIQSVEFDDFIKKAEGVHLKLNIYIKSCY